jgi:hypothetical protein
MTTGAEDLKNLVAEAEAAVAAVKDPELKRAAFEKILERLLSNGQSGPGKRKSGFRAAAAPAPKKAKDGPTARIEDLIETKFFKKPRNLADVKTELENQGHHIPNTTLSPLLLALCRKKKLRRQKGIAGDKSGYGYTNW